MERLRNIRQLIAGVLLLAAGSFMGYQFSERERMRTISFLSAELTAAELMANAAALQNIKMNRAACTRWLLETKVKSSVKNADDYRAQGNLPKSSLESLEKASKLGNVALTSQDRSGLEVINGC